METNTIKRRTFLKIAGLFSIASIAAIKGFGSDTKKSVEENIAAILQRTNGLIENQTFILSKPLEFYDCEGITIRNCVFQASPDFKGNALIVIDKTKHLCLEGNQFIPNTYNYCIDLKG